MQRPARAIAASSLGRGQARTSPEDGTTRKRVIDAAISCITEEGFYRASSNRIARRAGVTWGVIQYHFGTREGLLLAAFESSADDLATALANAVISGDTVTARIESLADVIWSYYRRPEFLASVQIAMNLGHDPRTAAATVDMLAELDARVTGRLVDLGGQVVDPGHQQPQPELARALFPILRGLAVGEELTDAMPGARCHPDAGTDPTRRILIDALGAFFEPKPPR